MKCSAGFFLRMDMLFIFGKTMLVLVLMSSMKKPEYCRQYKDEGQEARFNIFCFRTLHNRTAIVRIYSEQKKEDYPPWSVCKELQLLQAHFLKYFLHEAPVC